ncbi:MAG: ATP-binding protein [Desulfobacterales bacterium]|nr:ATP-binding protein [Desulfobacterales bacterium]
MKDRVFKKTRLMFVSPWLLAAAIGLLTLIIVIFAANNIKRERGMLSDGLYRKGEAIIRFVEAGMRASMMTGMMGGMMGLNVPDVDGVAQTQRLIEQASESPDIHYIAVIDVSGKVLVHSDPEKIGTNISREINILEKADTGGTFHIVKHPGLSHKVFELLGPFRPFKGSGGINRWREKFRQQYPSQGAAPPDNWHQSSLGSEEHPQFILVGLDMTELENTIKRYRVQMIFMSLTLLLVGLGGWISLMAAQGYSISQETLKRMRAFTGLLISKLPVGIIATDHENKIRTFNSTAAAMTGISLETVQNGEPEAVLPMEVSRFFSPHDNKDEMTDRAVSLVGADNVRYSLHLSSLPVFNQDSNFMGRVLLMYDLSELKRLEKEIQRHDRLVALGKMAAGVAHEVRNPLSSIKGFATLLGSKFKDGSQEHEAADLLVHEAERLNRSITELLNYARPTTLKKEQINLGDLVSSSLKLISSDAQALGVKTSLETDPDVPDITADRDRINQVLLNLYLNGLQAMEDSSREKELKVSVHFDDTEGRIRINVQDNGKGIPQESIDKVLDPYFTTKPEGTGLGLALAYKIIDEHDGTIRFKSTEGQGTTVIVTLPV